MICSKLSKPVRRVNELLHKPKALARLVKGGRPIGRHLLAVLGDLHQLRTSVSVGAGIRLLFCQRRIAIGVGNHRITADDDRLQKLRTRGKVATPTQQRREKEKKISARKKLLSLFNYQIYSPSIEIKSVWFNL